MKLIPYLIHDIVWDTEGEKTVAPNEVIRYFVDDEDAFDNAVSVLSDDFGYTVFNCKIKRA